MGELCVCVCVCVGGGVLSQRVPFELGAGVKELVLDRYHPSGQACPKRRHCHHPPHLLSSFLCLTFADAYKSFNWLNKSSGQR